MTEEMNAEVNTKEEKKCNCLCCSEGFRDFLKITLGSFVGVFLALSLFAAMHRPPMPMMPQMPVMPPCPCVQRMMMQPQANFGQHFDKAPRGDFHKMKINKKDMNREIPVKVNVNVED